MANYLVEEISKNIQWYCRNWKGNTYISRRQKLLDGNMKKKFDHIFQLEHSINPLFKYLHNTGIIIDIPYIRSMVREIEDYSYYKGPNKYFNYGEDMYSGPGRQPVCYYTDIVNYMFIEGTLEKFIIDNKDEIQSRLFTLGLSTKNV